MSHFYEKIIDFAQRMSLDITQQNSDEEFIIVTNENQGIYNMIIDCEAPILVMEQLIYTIKHTSSDHFKTLLQMNRKLIHGAFVLDEDATKVLFRDTLQIENLDFNEFEASIHSLELGLAEFSETLLILNQ